MAARQVTCRVPTSCVLRGGSVPGRRINRIVVYEPTDCIKPFAHTAPIGSAFGAPIRVCRGRIKGVCPPDICDCPSIPCKQPFRKRLKKYVITAVKIGIIGGIIFTTWLYGVWTDAEGTAILSYDYMQWARDFFWTRNKIKRTPQEIYDMGRIKYNFKNVCNNITFYTNELLQAIPRKFQELGEIILPKRAKVEENE